MLERYEGYIQKLEKMVEFSHDDYSIYTGTAGVVFLYWFLGNVELEEDIFNFDKAEGNRFMEKKLEKQKVCSYGSEGIVIYTDDNLFFRRQYRDLK